MLYILDRDGVINKESSVYIKSPDEWIPIPGSLEAIALLTKAGNKIVIASNQSGVGRGLLSLQMLEKIHQKMLSAIESFGGKIEKIYFCPHAPDDHCNCRKPKPGMLLQIQQDFQVKASEMMLIGDSLRDYEAAYTVRCPFILVKTGNGEHTIQTVPHVMAFDDLHAAVKMLLNNFSMEA